MNKQSSHLTREHSFECKTQKVNLIERKNEIPIVLSAQILLGDYLVEGNLKITKINKEVL